MKIFKGRKDYSRDWCVCVCVCPSKCVYKCPYVCAHIQDWETAIPKYDRMIKNTLIVSGENDFIQKKELLAYEHS